MCLAIGCLFVCFRCGVVTGGNKGIGLEISRQLAINGVMVILTARDEQRGAEAVNNLKSAGLSDVVFHQLDVTDPASIASLAKFIETRFRKLDILVSHKLNSRIIFVFSLLTNSILIFDIHFALHPYNIIFL